MIAGIREYFQSYERRVEVAERYPVLVAIIASAAIVAPFALLLLIGFDISVPVWGAIVLGTIVAGAAYLVWDNNPNRRPRS